MIAIDNPIVEQVKEMYLLKEVADYVSSFSNLSKMSKEAKYHLMALRELIPAKDIAHTTKLLSATGANSSLGEQMFRAIDKGIE